MPDPTYQSASAGQLATLLLLRWGDPLWPGAPFGADPEGGYRRVTDFGSTILVDAGVAFAPLEALEVRVGERQGGAEPDEFSVRMAASIEPWKTVVHYGDPVIEAFVWEVDPANIAATRRLVIRGQAARSRVHASGSPGVVEARFETFRSRFRVPLGFEISPYCRWQFGDAECGRDLEDYTFGDRVTELSGITLKAAVLNTTPLVNGLNLSTSWARFGFVRRGGLSIPISGHSGDTVTLRYPPPPGWLDRWVDFVAGCPKSASACGSFFGNLERFSGIGLATPTYPTNVTGGPG